jgi:plastocyanin
LRVFVVSMIVALTLAAAGCGSSINSSGTTAPTPAPTPTAAPPSGVVTIDVLFENGAQSFSPNPATFPPGQMVVWRNTDRVTHRVVLNDGSLDTGDLAPGASSQPMSITAGGGPYHCSIHPSMVGSIVPAAAAAK